MMAEKRQKPLLFLLLLLLVGGEGGKDILNSVKPIQNRSVGSFFYHALDKALSLV